MAEGLCGGFAAKVAAAGRGRATRALVFGVPFAGACGAFDGAGTGPAGVLDVAVGGGPVEVSAGPGVADISTGFGWVDGGGCRWF